MNNFVKITKKKFCEDISANGVIFVQGGFTSLTLDNSVFESEIIKTCEDINTDEVEKSFCVIKSNHFQRTLPDGNISYFHFDTKGSKTYYAYNNIRVIEVKYKDYDRNNYLIYLCV